MATPDQSEGNIAPASTHGALPSPTLNGKGVSRRRFAKAAGAGVGVIATLASQPGMATTVCASPSQSLSLAHSYRADNAPVCAGRLPNYWKSNTAWPTGCVRGEPGTPAVAATWYKPAVPAKPGTGTLCKDVFACATIPEYGATSLLDMCNPCSFDTNQIGAHLVAAYLNVKAGLITFMTVQDVRDIWSEIATTGVYKPNATTTWQPYDVVVYLKKIMS